MPIDDTTQRPTPIAAIAKGALAGIAGTLAMDLLWYARYRRGGGKENFIEWEFSADVNDYDQAATPAQVGKRLVEGYLRTELQDSAARAMNNAVHWATGTFWGIARGVVASSVGDRPRVLETIACDAEGKRHASR
jgi:hypothetical protein